MDIMNLINTEKTIAHRRYFHMHPEIAFKEFESTDYIERELAQYLTLEILRPTPTGLVAVLKGKHPGKTVGLRADFDALPITEETGLPFASKIPGMMHACGHDCHAAMLLGAVDVLYTMKDDLHGTIKFIFQHAEEKEPGGASQLIAAGILDDVDVFYGSHVTMEDKAGVVFGAAGPIYANTDNFAVCIQGKGAHAARPDSGIDPLLCGAEIVQSLNYIVSRNIPSAERAVLTVGTFHAGTADNIIADTAAIMGTVRSYKPEIRDLMERRINEVVNGIATAHGATATVKYNRGYNAVVNDETLHETFKEVIAPLPNLTFREMTPTMGGEDFSAYRAIAPAYFTRIGARPESKVFYGAHHPKFAVNEDALAIGTVLYTAFALRYVSPESTEVQ